ncbi:MAG: hypothetical protein HQM09_01200 [Candidatus Riflebacteria bacterium]|nr:hypothetical protein [Candidatus Riflebacteria bacterium]
MTTFISLFIMGIIFAATSSPIFAQSDIVSLVEGGVPDLAVKFLYLATPIIIVFFVVLLVLPKRIARKILRPFRRVK